MTFAFPREDFGFFGRQTTDGSACFSQVWRWFESRLQDLRDPGLFLKCSFWVLNLKLVDLPGPPPPCWILNSKSCFPSIKRQPKSTEQNVEFIFLWFLSLWDLCPWVLSALAVLRALPSSRFFCCFYAASLVLNRKSTSHSRCSVAAGSRAPSMGPTSCLLQARSCLGGVDTEYGCESWNFRPTAEGRLVLGVSCRAGSLPLLLPTAWPWVSHRNCQGLRVHALQSGSNTCAVYFIGLVWGEPLGHGHSYSENREVRDFLSNTDDAVGPTYRDGVGSRAFCYVYCSRYHIPDRHLQTCVKGGRVPQEPSLGGGTSGRPQRHFPNELNRAHQARAEQLRIMQQMWCVLKGQVERSGRRFQKLPSLWGLAQCPLLGASIEIWAQPLPISLRVYWSPVGKPVLCAWTRQVPGWGAGPFTRKAIPAPGPRSPGPTRTSPAPTWPAGQWPHSRGGHFGWGIPAFLTDKTKCLLKRVSPRRRGPVRGKPSRPQSRPLFGRCPLTPFTSR